MKQIERFKSAPILTQKIVLETLIEKGKRCEFGRKHNFSIIKNYSDFKQHVPLSTYADLEGYLSKIKEGKAHMLWPGKTNWFAQSSGTATGRSKLIPVTKDALKNCHYKGGKDLLALYYYRNPNTRLFNGKHLIVGGSADINYFSANSYFGDLSAIILDNLPWWCELRRAPDKKIALMSDWEKKLDRMASATAKEDIHILAGVPSWTLLLLHSVLEKTGAKNIMEVWPNLELYLHGGVSFEPYREQFKTIIANDKMNYLQTYNASEGFFGIQDANNSEEMLLMLDYGVFYEFIPQNNDTSNDPVALEEVVTDINYALVISSNAGLWRYQIGDVIRFSSTKPYRFKIMGRVAHFLNVFGEELIVHNTDTAIAHAALKHNCSVNEYTVCPVFMQDGKSGCHQWLIEFEVPPFNFDSFMVDLDELLKNLNSDYAAKRVKDLNLRAPLLINLIKGTFYDWLVSKNKLGGQHKVPRLQNDRAMAEELMQINEERISEKQSKFSSGVACLIFLILSQLPLIGQSGFQVTDSLPIRGENIEIDILGKSYSFQNNLVEVYDPSGKKLFTYSDKFAGQIDQIDVSNNLRPVIFYKQNSRVHLMDNTLSLQGGGVISLESVDLYQAVLVANSSFDNGIWLFDQELLQIVKINQKLERIYETGNLLLLLGLKELTPLKMLEQNGMLYLSTKSNGFFVFDQYGVLFKRINLNNILDFQVVSNKIYFIENNLFKAYDMITFETENIPLPFAEVEKVRWVNDKIYVVSRNKIFVLHK